MKSYRKPHFASWLGENDLSVGNSKPDHKWTYFEHNSWLPRTERNQRKSQSILEVWIHSEFRKAVLTFVSEQLRPSFCNTLQSLILLKEVSVHFPWSLVLVDHPVGLYHFYNHIWNFTLMESCSCSSWNIHVLFTYWSGCGENLVRPFACMRAAFGRANIKTEKIQECLHRSGERRSQLNTVPGFTLPANSREYGIFGR